MDEIEQYFSHQKESYCSGKKMTLVSKRKMCFCCHKNKLALRPMLAKKVKKIEKR
jgi:hypothetical protein